MKKRKKIAIVLKVILIAVCICFVIFRYGWRLFGYSMCNDMIWLEDIVVSEDEVTAECVDYGSFPRSVIGCKVEQKDDIVYIGVKYNYLLGVLPTDMTSAKIRVPVKGTINQIVVKGGNGEKIVWDREGKDKLGLHISITDEKMNVLRYRCYRNEEMLFERDLAFEDQDFTFYIRKNDFPKDMDLSQLRIDLFAIEDDKEVKIGDIYNFNAEWGGIYDLVITKQDNKYTLKAQEN